MKLQHNPRNHIPTPDRYLLNSDFSRFSHAISNQSEEEEEEKEEEEEEEEEEGGGGRRSYSESCTRGAGGELFNQS